jgi:hypothetical protein
VIIKENNCEVYILGEENVQKSRGKDWASAYAKIKKKGRINWTNAYAKTYRRVEEKTGRMLMRRRTEEWTRKLDKYLCEGLEKWKERLDECLCEDVQKSGGKD